MRLSDLGINFVIVIVKLHYYNLRNCSRLKSKGTNWGHNEPG